MARSVYSSPLIIYNAGTPNTEYEVAAGTVAVVRFISAQQADGAFNWRVYLQLSLDAPATVFAAGSSAGFWNYDQWEGRVVCPAGSILTLDMQDVGSSANAYVGGYVLTN